MLDVDCTRMKRVGRWCDGCASLLAKSTIGEYIMPNTLSLMKKKRRSIMGRPANTDLIMKVRSLFAEGKTYGYIMKELGITDTKTIYRYRIYPQEKIEKQLECAAKQKA